MRSLSLARLTAIFLRVGNVTFGGGDPATAALYSELVASRRWLAPEKYAMCFALARITPGTNILAFCAGVAWELAGWRAALLAVLAASIPSAACVVLFTVGYEAWNHYPRATAAIAGILAASVGLMLTGAWQLLEPQFATGDGRSIARAAAFAAGALALSYWFQMGPVAVLGLAALGGFFWEGPAR